MAIHLIRHAHAGRRSAWDGDDRQRPLSDKGRRQADGLVALLDGEPVGEIWSSPYRRCIETVLPLGRSRGIEVTEEPLLTEGASAERLLACLRDRTTHDLVLCSHGDVIPSLVRLLLAGGMRADGGVVAKKASTWRLEVDRGQITSGRYLPPPT